MLLDKKVPSFSGYTSSSPSASKAKRGNRGKDTAPELVLRRTLWRHGVRYRLDSADLPGKPDLVLRRKRIVVFCDGDFWHGRNWKTQRAQLRRRANAAYWVAKISYNRARDKRLNRLLQAKGWTVIRLWETDIHANAERAARLVLAALHQSAAGRRARRSASSVEPAQQIDRRMRLGGLVAPSPCEDFHGAAEEPRELPDANLPDTG